MKTTRKYIVEEKVCGTCVHYRQHYARTADGWFEPLWYGHCRTPRSKYPLPSEVCLHWEGYEDGGTDRRASPPHQKEPASAC